jgi:hypothetical protein
MESTERAIFEEITNYSDYFTGVLRDDIFDIVIKNIVFSSCIFSSCIFSEEQTTIENFFDSLRDHLSDEGNERLGNICFENCAFGELYFSESLRDYEFRNCEIEKATFEAIRANKEKPFYFKFIGTSMRQLNVNQCSFAERFYINPQYRDEPEFVVQIQSLVIQDSIFGHNFKLHNCEVSKCNINNTDFEKNADFFKSKFLQTDLLAFKSLNFRGLALFGECEFHSRLLLEYVTLEKLSHFREATFKAGLDLEKANIQSEMNFFGAKELDSEASFANTSQETYRIIKYNFSKIGNKIEENRYFALELKKRKQYLMANIWQNKLDLTVFTFHYFTSDFSRNWALSLFWIVTIGALTNEYLHYWTYQPFRCDYDFSWSLFWDFLNQTTKYMSIFNDDTELKNIPWLFFAHKVFLGYLYYQFVTSVRKDTQK